MHTRRRNPRIGEIVRHHDSGLLVRVDSVPEHGRIIITFVDGAALNVPADHIERNVTEVERTQFDRELVLVRSSRLCK